MSLEVKNFEFLFPIDGDCVNEFDGEIQDGELIIPVSVKAKSQSEIYINGQKASENAGVYTAKVKLSGFRNAISVNNISSGESAKITVFKLTNPIKKFRISSDDNILFLQDINDNKDKYKSIFENPYLAVYKKAHDLYKAKVHINLFYEFDENAQKCFSKKREYFNLSMMTDKFKDEFKANSDWLKFSFHAHTEFPDAPYEHATGEKIKADCIRVAKEIVRFAGEDSLPDTTTVHWGEANVECIRALRSLGIKNFAGYFDADDNGDYIVSYYLKHDKKLCEYLHERDFYCDTLEDVFFAKIDCVTNIGTLENAMEKIQNALENPHTCGFISFMIHEQYFYEDYINYEPDFEKRVLEPSKLLFEKGYLGEHLTNILDEPKHSKAITYKK